MPNMPISNQCVAKMSAVLSGIVMVRNVHNALYLLLLSMLSVFTIQ